MARRFKRWKNKHQESFGLLVLSVMHPITRDRMESSIVEFILEELPRSGFRVISAEAIQIVDLHPKEKDGVCDIIARHGAIPEKISCASKFKLTTFDGRKICYEFPFSFRIDEKEDIKVFQKCAVIAQSNKYALINELNGYADQEWTDSDSKGLF
jgi:hypothetical protein